VRVILGLGNPGKKYVRTRHNVGFMVVDRLEFKHSLKLKPGKGDYYFSSGTYSNHTFSIVIPTTYMNNSGLAAKHFIEKYEVNPKDMLVICDDIHLSSGTIRIRAKGSDGGHNGLKSIIYELERNDFPRLRIGIGNEFEENSQSDFVLSQFSENELSFMNNTFEVASKICDEFITGGLKAARDFFSKENQKTIDTEKNKAIN